MLSRKASVLTIALRLTKDQLWRFLAVALATFVLLGPAAYAQTTGTIQGTVTDTDGIGYPDASVTVASPQMIGGQQVRSTDADGFYKFTDLLPGAYSVTVVAEGFPAEQRQNVLVQINRQVTVDVQLKEGSTTTIIVEGNSGPIVDTESTTVGQVLTQEFLQRVPSGRSYQDAVQLSAGVSKGSGGNPNMAGGGTSENTFLLDGATVTDPVTGTFGQNFNFDAIQQIEVLLGGFDAEYGISLGGIINIVTDNGTNNLEFDTSVYYQNGGWSPKKDARYTSDGYDLAATQFDSAFQTLQIGAKVSGPLVQDKAWFVFSYQHDRSLIASTGMPQKRDYDGNYLLGKLTIQPNNAHRVSLLFQADPTVIDNISQGNPFQKAESQGRQAQSGFVGQVRWQWFLTENSNLDTRIGLQKISIEQYAVPCTHNENSDSNKCKPTEQEGFVDFETPGRLGLFGAFDSVNWGTYVFDDRWRFSASSKYSLTGLKDKVGGSHDLKFGVETAQFVNNSVTGYSGNLRYVDINQSGSDPNTLTNYYWLETSAPIIERDIGSTWSVFAQDAYKPVSNFTIRYGLRFDNTVLRNDVGDPVIRGSIFSPRLFVSWDPFGDQKTKLAGGYGRFNETGTQSLASFTSQAGFGSKLFFGELFNDNKGRGFLNSSTLMYDFGPRENLNTANKNLKLPGVDEFNVIFQREIVSDLSIGFNFQGRFTRNLYDADETNIIYDEDGSQVIGARTGDILNNYLRLRTPRAARRNYYRFDLSLIKREAKRWFAQGTYSYTFMNGTNNSSLEGTFTNDPQTQYTYGRLANGSEHSVRAQAYYNVPTDPWDLSIGAAVSYDSGVPLERAYWSDANAGYNLRIENRGFYYHFNDEWDVGIRLRQALDVRKGKLNIDLEVANVFNFQAPSGLSSILYTKNRIMAVSRQSPLRMQLGLQYQF